MMPESNQKEANEEKDDDEVEEKENATRQPHHPNNLP